jgi:hypothetical protein
VGLADDVQVEDILVSNVEDFSANLGQIKFSGSIDYPPSQPWVEIGSIEPGEQCGVHVLSTSNGAIQNNIDLVRYLKIEMFPSTEF